MLPPLIVFLLVLAPVGYALLVLAGDRPSLQDLGIALPLGACVVFPLLLLEIGVGPWFILPVVGVSTFAVARARPVAGSLWILLLPALLGLLTLWINSGDARVIGPDGPFAFRNGFDINDKSFYVLIAQELLRAGPVQAENPLFAGVPFSYSFLPSLGGLFLHRYGGATLISTFFVYLPVVSMMMTAAASWALLEQLGVHSFRTRIITILLLVLGGDFSFLVPILDLFRFTEPERLGDFYVFQSFTAQSLHYNPWMLGLPLTLAGLTVAHRWLSGGSRGSLLLAGLLFGSLAGTKIFAFLLLVPAALAAGALLKDRRLLALSAVAAIAAVPWIAVAMSAGAPSPFAVAWMFPVTSFVERWAMTSWGAWIPKPAGRGLLLLPAAAIFLAGGMGVRLFGAARLVEACRREAGPGDDSGFHRWLALAMTMGVAATLVLVGVPVEHDGLQFIMLTQFLAWLYAGPALVRLAEAETGARVWRMGALALLLIAAAGPLRYFAMRKFPAALTSRGASDRAAVLVPEEIGRASRWVRNSVPAGDAMALPPSGKYLYPALLADRRLVAFHEPLLGVPRAIATTRFAALTRLFTTADAADGERAIDELGASWVWEEPANPLHFTSPRLEVRFESAAARIYFVRPAS